MGPSFNQISLRAAEEESVGALLNQVSLPAAEGEWESLVKPSLSKSVCELPRAPPSSAARKWAAESASPDAPLSSICQSNELCPTLGPIIAHLCQEHRECLGNVRPAYANQDHNAAKI